jgi:uncharacterized membrane protein HdeD (DUF308 family)
VLRERVFEIGGILTIVAGILLLAAFALNPVWLLWGILEAGALLIAFGAFFLYVGRGSRKDRRRLLESPRPPS